MPIERKKTLNVFKDARDAWGSYDDFPVGQPAIDPMPHLSRNRVAQPFYLVSEADQVVIQMAGRGEIRFREIDPPLLVLEPGDTVYIPACVPSQLVPYGENVQVRLKAASRNASPGGDSKHGQARQHDPGSPAGRLRAAGRHRTGRGAQGRTMPYTSQTATCSAS